MDDAVDLNDAKPAAVLTLRDRLDLIYADRPRNAPADRAFAAVVEDHDMPRTLPEALLEGLAWDAMGRRYGTLSELFDYSARVAAAVGAMMCVLMGVRDANALARACDLGVAMQLTNISRDVGEDAAEGRLYLPLDWLDEAGISVETIGEERDRHRVFGVVRRFLDGRFPERIERALRAYLEAGGFLLADACCGRQAFDAAFRREIKRALKLAGGNKSQVARDLKISYPNLLKKVRHYGLG